MRTNFGEFFHQKSKDKTMDGLVSIPLDSSKWPENWKDIEYKTYTRFEKIKLPTPQSKQVDRGVLATRESLREFDTNSPVTLQALSNILFYSCGEVGVSVSRKNLHRIQPSGGGRYPIEAYVLNLQSGDLEQCCYHYDVQNHSLDKLWPVYKERSELKKLFTYEWCDDASFAIILTAVPDRTTRKYGERGYRYIYIEAGAIVGYLVQNAVVEDLGAVVMGGTNDKSIEALLDVDGIKETLIMGVVMGKRSLSEKTT
jgi:SagB-type dehydrogenase family enzyme